MMCRSIVFFLVVSGTVLSPSLWARSELFLALVTLDQATQQVMAQTGGKVLAARTEVESGQRVHIIKILTSDGRVQYVKIDANSGRRMN